MSDDNAPIVCIKPSLYKQFSFLAELYDSINNPDLVPSDKQCSLIVKKGKKEGDGIVEFTPAASWKYTGAVISEDGTIHKGLLKGDYESYYNGTLQKTEYVEGTEKKQVKIKIEPKLAVRFITAVFGPSELSDKARKEYCKTELDCKKFENK